jgi:ribosome biogenesis protein MAK21
MHRPEDSAKQSVVSITSSPSIKEPRHSEAYDPRKREPQYAHAETTCLWELVSHGDRFDLCLAIICFSFPFPLAQVPLLHHFHPSVSLHARQILTAVQVTATADLGLNTLSHFLDRFVYKNPKKPKPRGASAMQPMAAAHDETGMVRLVRGVGGPGTGTVNEEGFWKKPVAEVPVDQVRAHSPIHKCILFIITL